MADMLVKLYTLPDAGPGYEMLKEQSIFIRRAMPEEKRFVIDWVKEHFAQAWADGCEFAILRDPGSCFIAVEKDRSFVPNGDPYDLPKERLVGFACYDVSSRGMFGPMGVHEEFREKGIGRGLLLACLHAMAAERYAYAVIGWVGPVEFYTKTVGATFIEGSAPGIYHGKLT